MKRLNNLKNIAITTLLLSSISATIAYSAKISKKAEEKKDNLNSIIYVFPTEPENNKESSDKTVMTGIFKDKIFEKKSEPKKKVSPKEKEQNINVLPLKKVSDETIAWTNLLSSYYHDPFNNCQNTEDRTMTDNKEDIVGLEPCPDCFKKRQITPKFIQKEFENKEIADANNLMINSEFVEWISQRLPIKEMTFISGTMLLVYPNLEMTNKGLYQLAIKIQIIELLFKQN